MQLHHFIHGILTLTTHNLIKHNEAQKRMTRQSKSTQPIKRNKTIEDPLNGVVDTKQLSIDAQQSIHHTAAMNASEFISKHIPTIAEPYYEDISDGEKTDEDEANRDEVNLRQDDLSTSINTAKTLEFKGLSEHDGQPASIPSTSSTHSPIKSTNSPTAKTRQGRITIKRSLCEISSCIADPEDSWNDEATTVVLQPAQKRSIHQSTLAQPIKTSPTLLDVVILE